MARHRKATPAPAADRLATSPEPAQALDQDEPAEPASPPCLMHEVDPAYMGLPAEPPPKRRPRGGSQSQ